MANTRSGQSGATLVVVMIFLILMSLFAVSAFNSSTGNSRIVGNSQVRQEAIAAAQAAIEQVISSTYFTENPATVAATPVPVDMNGNGTPGYYARMTPAPSCSWAHVLQPSELDIVNSAADRSCVGSGAAQPGVVGPGGPAAAPTTSLCAESNWNVRSQVTDAATNTQVAVNQGVGVRVLSTVAYDSCHP